MTTAQAEGFAGFESWLGTPLPADPIAAMRTLRALAEQEIERLLAFLDVTDGDSDLEGEFAGFEAPQDGREADDADAEPSLGWTERGPRAFDELSHDVDAELDDADAEPSLASPEGVRCPEGPQWGGHVAPAGSQIGWARGSSRDLEGAADEDDEESDNGLADTDALAEMSGNEPSLGASEAINQLEAWRAPQDEWLGPDRERAPRRQPLKKQAEGQKKISSADDISSRLTLADRPPLSNVRPIDGRPLTLVDPDGKIMRIDADGRIC